MQRDPFGIGQPGEAAILAFLAEYNKRRDEYVARWGEKPALSHHDVSLLQAVLLEHGFGGLWMTTQKKWKPVAELPDWDQRRPRQLIFVEGSCSHSGVNWRRQHVTEAWTDKEGPQGYRREDIERAERDGDMDPGTGLVTHWMPWAFLEAETQPMDSRP